MIDPSLFPIAPQRHLDRAIAFGRFSTHETVILQQVVEACSVASPGWAGDGPRTRLPNVRCRLVLSQLARMTGLSRLHLAAARRDLVAGRVLVEADGSWLAINDRVERWIHPSSGEPRLTPKLVEFCRAAGEGGGDPDGQ